MRSYVYRALFEPGDRRGNIVVSFPDVPEAITQGRGEADARAMAEEALGLVLLDYLERRQAAAETARQRPRPYRYCGRAGRGGQARGAGIVCRRRITKSELARRIGKDEKEVRRILDPRHPTKLPALTAALRALGKRLVVGVMEAEAA